MSTTFHLVCHETKQTLWIGQGRGGEMTTLYYGEPETMGRLRAFLNATAGKPLVLMNDHTIENLDGYAELDDMTPAQILATGPAP